MEITQLKLLVAGVGSIGRRHSDVLYTSLNCKNITLYDPLLERAEEHAARYPGMYVVKTYEQGLAEKPDAVFVLTPTAMHVEHTLRALEAGCHVMIEKPLAISFDGVDKIKSYAKEKNKIVSVAFCMRYHEGIRRVKMLSDSGCIGKIVNIRAEMGEYFPDSRPDYLTTYYVRYSGSFELMHAVDMSLWVAGGNPDLIFGIYGSGNVAGFQSPDNAEVLFRTETGTTCSVHMSFYRLPGINSLNVYGTNGTITLVFTYTDYTLGIFSREKNQWEINTVNNLNRNQLFEREDQEFLESIVTGNHMGCTVEDAERSLKIYCKVYGEENRPPKEWT